MDLDFSGSIRTQDSLKFKTSYTYYSPDNYFFPCIRRIDSNRIALSVVSDSTVTVHNQTYYSTRNPTCAMDSWFFYLDRRSSQDEQSFHLSTEMCSLDSLSIPVIGFPDGPDLYRFELSDSSGSFSNPIVLGTVSSRRFLVHFPAGLPDGDHYSIRVFSSNQQKYSGSYKVNIAYKSTLGPPTVLPLGPLEFCAGKSVKLVANSGANIEWDSYQIADTLTVFYGGTHYATARFGSCKAKSLPVTTKTIDHHITLPDLLKSTVCVPSYTTYLTRVDSGGYWYGPQVDSVAQTFTPGVTNDTIQIHYRNDHFPACPVDSSFTIIQKERPWLPDVGDSISCVGGSVNLKKLFLPNTTWNGNMPMDSVFVPASQGNTYFQVTRSEGGCESYTNFTIYIPNPSDSVCLKMEAFPEMGILLPSNPVCAGTATTVYLKNRAHPFPHYSIQYLEISDLNGSFSQPTVLTFTNLTPMVNFYIPNTIPNGDYRIRVRMKYPDTIFYDSSQVFRIRSLPPGYPYIQVAGPGSFCEGTVQTSTRFFVSGPYEAHWTSDNWETIADTIQPIPGNQYFVRFSNDGCLGNSSSRTFSKVPKKNIILFSPRQICVPATPFVLSSNFPLSASAWSGPFVNQATKKFSPPNLDDSLVLSLTARYGPMNACYVDSQFVFTTRKKPIFPTVADTFLCQNSVSMVLPYTQWQSQWTGSGIVNNASYIPLPGHIMDTLHVTASHDFCSANGLLRVQVRDSTDATCSLSFNQARLPLEKYLIVYPNPNNGRFKVQSSIGLGTEKFQIRDGMGRIVVTTRNTGNDIDLRSLPAGRYWVCAAGHKAIPVEIQ